MENIKNNEEIFDDYIAVNAEKLKAIYTLARIASNEPTTEAEYWDSLGLVCSFLFDAALEDADGLDEVPENAADFFDNAIRFRGKARKARKMWTEKIGAASDGPMVKANIAPVLKKRKSGKTYMIVSAEKDVDNPQI